MHLEELDADALHVFGGAAGVGGEDPADGGDEARDLHLDGSDVCSFEEANEEGEVGSRVSWGVRVIGETLADFADVLEGPDCQLPCERDGGELYLLQGVEGPEPGHYVDEAGCS